MIVSVMFYVLYPLSRFIGRLSELRRKAPSVYVNGKEVWDGGGALSGQQQTGLSQQWHSEGNTDTGPDPDHTETESPQGTVEMPWMEASASSVNDGNEDSEEEALVLKEENFSTSVLRCLEETSDSDSVINESAKTEFQRHPDAQDTKDERSCAQYLTADIGGIDACAIYDDHKMDSSTSDIYLGFDPDAGKEALLQSGSPVFDLAALLADSQQVETAAEPIGWHFPTGVGLSQMSYCPYVQFPDFSYYPAFQDNDRIEVMWRVWEDLSETHTGACGDTAAAFDFSIMSYNILAQDLLEANPGLYTHCPEDVLAWDGRLWTILKELQIWQPDILCLQEVQEDHFLEQMFPVLTDMGYTCIYKRRTGTKTDGCAVCYRSERFTQLSVNLLEFCRPDCELLDRDNVGIVLLLQPLAGQNEAFSPICVANTHLLFNPRRGDVKLAQLAIVFAEIDLMIKKCSSEGRRCEVILCGDFNALPNSPLWKFITTGQLYYYGLPTWMVSGQMDLSYKVYHPRLFAPLWPSSLDITDSCQYKSESQTAASGIFPVDNRQYSHDFMLQLRYCQAACVRPADLELIPGVTDKTPDPEDMEIFSSRFGHTLRHTLSLTSAYSQVRPDTQTAAVTTLNSDGAAMVDYIFYSTRRSSSAGESAGGLQLLGRLSLLSEADLWCLKGLPNETFPSDHLSLLVKLQLR
ncbi:protein angel homolog 1 [Ctenopharyngodon idella]|uniref:protein angel homolog 1 n=1 Tax=Ctenopharyngodon idella TaxID=7959 RepID=UPI0022306D12|nr:protein angel homolog 1 [Ctenopharyngodon idella]XP_051722868.1 protein angel homolog 1 [Ctenopharyngodon idella]XP_051722869.1 protein angel homolog 1 [Ctenopharyngodon idella]